MTETVTKIDVKSLEADKRKSIEVEKLLDLNIDVGTLLAIDPNDLDKAELKKNKDKYLHVLARGNAQLLLNEIWKLPTERVEEAIVAKLPAPTFILPREKPAPKPKPLTKWEQFAKEKGLKTTRKDKLVWDDVLQKWVPRYGYKKAAAEREKDWLIEIPENADPYQDFFQKKAEQKSEKVSKNEFQRLRNLARAKNIKVPSMGLPPTEKMSSIQVNTAAQLAHTSTASLGKFQPKLGKEKQLNNASILKRKKRKLPPIEADRESRNNLSLAESVLQKRPKFDLDKAINREIHDQERQTSEDKKTRKSGKGKKAKGGGKRRQSRSKGDKKPPAGKGNRNFKGGQKGGRKRR